MPEDDDNAGGGEGMVSQVELDYYDNMGRNTFLMKFIFDKLPH